MEELQAYYRRAPVPDPASFLVAGAVDDEGVIAALEVLSSPDRRAQGDVSFPAPPAWAPDRAGSHVLDVRPT